MLEKLGWVIMKDNNFPSTNYILYNTGRLTDKDRHRHVEGLIPKSKVAYYTSYESAYKRLNMELAEGGM